MRLYTHTHTHTHTVNFKGEEKELLKKGRGAEIFSGSNFDVQNSHNCGQGTNMSCGQNVENNGAQNAETSSHYSPLTFHHSGITLIALIITIVIMLILASITINLTLGENSIFLKAKDAKQNYEIASVKEQIMMEMSKAEVNGINNGTKMTRARMSKILSNNDNVEGIEYDTDNRTPKNAVLKNGQKILVSDLMNGEEFQAVGPEANSVPSMLVDTNREWDLTKVTPISDGTNIIPIPQGFYYVGGTKDTGVVISDNVADVVLTAGVGKTAHTENKNLQGNQFVWVPVTGKIEIARSDFGTNKNSNGNFADCIDVFDGEYRDGTATHRTESTRTLSFDNDETTLANYDAMKTSVNNYGGFYVARYEASTSDFAGNSGKTSGATAGNVLSKANGKPWDAINQTQAKAKCEAMYNGSSSVKSLLMSSYTWDATLSFIQNKGDEKDVSSNSTTWGNYKNRRGVKDKITFTGNYINATWSWGTIGTFNSNNTWTNGTDVSSAEMSNYLKLGTGTSESTKANNIYDIAGNMWEWTTEVSRNGSEANNRVLRGGSLFDPGSDWPSSARISNDCVSYTDWNRGFRPQLFIQM